MFKKILGLALCVVASVSIAIPTDAAKDTMQKAEVLRGLGVCQENPVTYDNFINSLAGFLYEEPGMCGTAETIARNTGMIDRNETYSGSSSLTVGKAYELAVIALGYKPAIGEDGNYMQKALELGLADGIAAGGDERLKQDTAVEILYNMLDAPPLVRTYGGLNGPGYKVANGENLLSVNRDVYVVKGIVTGTEITSIYGEEYVAGNGCIAIGDVSYEVGAKRYDRLLGKNVVAYIQESDTYSDTVLYVEENEDKNETVVIDCEDIVDIGESISSITYYQNDNRTKKINIVASPRVIYNGMFLETYTEDDFRSGELELIDHNGDKIFDVIVVSAYQTVVVEAIESGEMIIRNRYRFADDDYDYIPELKLKNPSEGDIIYRIYDGTGQAVEFSAIKCDDVLSVLQSKDGKIIEIYISGNGELTGTVTGTDRSENALIIDGKAYKKSKDFEKLIEDTQKTVKPGDAYIFSIDYFGRLAYVKETFDNNYSMLIKAYQDEKTDEYYIVYMDLNGDWYTVQVSEKVKIDGEKPDYLPEEMDVLIAKAPQVVLLKFNAKNQVVSIDTTNETKDSSFCEKAMNSCTYRSGQRYFHSTSGSDVVYLEDDAKVIVIPADGSTHKEDWNIYSAGSFFKGDNRIPYSIVCFNPDEFYFTDLVTVVHSSNIAKTNASEALYVITGFEKILAGDDEHSVIKGSVDGFINLSFIVGEKAEERVDDLREGDVISFSLDQNGMIDYIETKFSLYDFSVQLGEIYATTALHAGIVENIDYEEGKLLLDCGADNPIPFRLKPNMQVTVYHEGKGCESKTLASISREDALLIRTSYGKVVEIIKNVKN